MSVRLCLAVTNSRVVYDAEVNACADLLARATHEDHAFFELVINPAPAATADQDLDE